MRIKLFVKTLLTITIAALFFYPAEAVDNDARQPKPLQKFKDERTVTERTIHGLKYMVRQRNPNESWYDYFCNVLLSLGNERGRLDFGFQNFQKDKVQFAFIPFTVFDVKDVGLIVAIKASSIKDIMNEIYLRPRPGREGDFDLAPVSFVESKCKAEDVYFLIYDRPKASVRQINIDFPRFKAGCVAMIRDEEEARQYYRPVRSFAELAGDIVNDTRSEADKTVEKEKKEKCINATHKITRVIVNPQNIGLEFTITLKPGTEDSIYDIKTEFLEGEEVYDIKTKLTKGQSEFKYYVPYEAIPKIVALAKSARKKGFIEEFGVLVKINKELNESEKNLNIYDSALTSADTARFRINK